MQKHTTVTIQQQPQQKTNKNLESKAHASSSSSRKKRKHQDQATTVKSIFRTRTLGDAVKALALEKQTRQQQQSKSNNQSCYQQKQLLSQQQQNSSSLILKFPDPELNERIVKEYSTQIESVVFENPPTPRYCFVRLKTDAKIDEVCKEISQISFGSGKIQVEKVIQDENDTDDIDTTDTDVHPEDIDPYTLCIDYLPLKITYKMLAKYFVKAKHIEIKYGIDNSRRYALIHYDAFTDAMEAYKISTILSIHNHKLNVRFKRKNNSDNNSSSQLLRKKKLSLNSKELESKSPRQSRNNDDDDDDDDDDVLYVSGEPGIIDSKANLLVNERRLAATPDNIETKRRLQQQQQQQGNQQNTEIKQEIIDDHQQNQQLQEQGQRQKSQEDNTEWLMSDFKEEQFDDDDEQVLDNDYYHYFDESEFSDYRDSEPEEVDDQTFDFTINDLNMNKTIEAAITTTQNCTNISTSSTYTTAATNPNITSSTTKQIITTILDDDEEDRRKEFEEQLKEMKPDVSTMMIMTTASQMPSTAISMIQSNPNCNSNGSHSNTSLHKAIKRSSAYFMSNCTHSRNENSNTRIKDQQQQSTTTTKISSSSSSSSSKKESTKYRDELDELFERMNSEDDDFTF